MCLRLNIFFSRSVWYVECMTVNSLVVLRFVKKRYRFSAFCIEDCIEYSVKHQVKWSKEDRRASTSLACCKKRIKSTLSQISQISWKGNSGILQIKYWNFAQFYSNVFLRLYLMFSFFLYSGNWKAWYNICKNIHLTFIHRCLDSAHG